jgi:sialate O-acetylesterase
LELASIFSDHMVLQRDCAIPIWGSAAPGAVVRVQLGERTRQVTTDAQGAWRVELGPLAAGGPLELRVWSEGALLQLTDILVGEVWVASGQSNMQWTVANADAAETTIAQAEHPQLRLLTLPRQTAPQPQSNFKSTGWQVCSAETVRDFSAVAYSFGQALHAQLGVPIGLISTNNGGTRMEAWTSHEALASRPPFAADAQSAQAAAESSPSRPAAALDKNHPTGLYNAMIHPLIPFAMRGVIWYQGEANADAHVHYRELSELMIGDWRKRWGQGDFPFLLVQLAGYSPSAHAWPALREAQWQTVQTVPHTGMVVTTDLGDPADIHPRRKQAVGQRLALVARALAYGEEIVYSGPTYRAMRVDGSQVRLEWDHVGGGLVAQGGPLQGFEIAGAGGDYLPATATIEGEELVVSSDAIKNPVAVRYNWSGWTEGNLYNEEGLPAAPFRTERF